MKASESRASVHNARQKGLASFTDSIREGGEMIDNSNARVLSVRVDARKNLSKAVIAATETLRALEADGYSLKGLEIRGHLLRKR